MTALTHPSTSSTDFSATSVALLEVGHIVKPHGLRGEVVVRFVSNRPERLRPGEQMLVLPPGASTPSSESLEIMAIRPQRDCYLVVFAGIDDRDGADRLRGARLLAESIDDADALFVHDLVGSEVFDTNGERKGRVTAVEANPASDLLVVDGRAYVPARFVVSRSEGRIVIDPPEGLFD